MSWTKSPLMAQAASWIILENIVMTIVTTTIMIACCSTATFPATCAAFSAFVSGGACFRWPLVLRILLCTFAAESHRPWTALVSASGLVADSGLCLCILNFLRLVYSCSRISAHGEMTGCASALIIAQQWKQ